MKKLFFAICFIFAAASFGSANAAVKQMRDEIALQQYNADKSMEIKPAVSNRQIPASFESFRDFIRERAKQVEKMPMELVQKSSTMNSVEDAAFIASQKQEKSTFEQIYNSAMERLNLMEQQQPGDLINTPALIPQEMQQQQMQAKQQWKKDTGIDVVSVTLPTGQSILVPAKEHIPYLTSKIDIMPNGIVRIIETVNLVANGQKLKYGLTKALPKYSISRDGVKNATIPYLNSVRINGTEVPYQLKDAGDRYLITPKNQFALQPGIYTYEFDYMLDRKLWYYKDRNEFYWDVTGSFWNLVVSQAVATVRLPVDVNPLGQSMFIGYPPNNLTDYYSTITKDRRTNALGFTATTPLFAGEGMHLLISIPKAGFIEPDFNKKFEWFIEDYGDIIFSLFGLLAIVIAYIVSWRFINSDANPVKTDLQKTPAMLRMLAKGSFDKVSFGSFLLDLFRRNIIDLKADHESLVLIKKTDNLNRLNKNERQALRQLIGPKELSVSFNRTNALKMKRAYKLVEKDTVKRLKILSLKLNSGYILFSCAMLLLAEAAIAWLNVNTAATMGFLVSATLTAAFYIWILRTKFKRRWVNITAKVFAVIMIIIAALMMSLHIHAISTIFILGMIWSIFVYSSLFAKRNGLIKNNIKEAIQFGQYLTDSAEAIILGREFKQQQANIYALDAAGKYPKTDQIAADYRLDLMPMVKNLL